MLTASKGEVASAVLQGGQDEEDHELPHQQDVIPEVALLRGCGVGFVTPAAVDVRVQAKKRKDGSICRLRDPVERLLPHLCQCLQMARSRRAASDGVGRGKASRSWPLVFLDLGGPK